MPVYLLRFSASTTNALLFQVGEACLHLAAEATYTTGIEYILSGGAELGYSRKYAVKTPEELDEALDLERTRKKGEKWLSVPAD